MTMLKATAKALEGSIHKWEEIVAGTRRDRACYDCPLCQRFYSLRCGRHTPTQDDKEVCPAKVTDASGCCDGLYSIYATDPTTENAQAMLDFLKGLREVEPEEDGR